MEEVFGLVFERGSDCEERVMEKYLYDKLLL